VRIEYVNTIINLIARQLDVSVLTDAYLWQFQVVINDTAVCTETHQYIRACV